MEAKIDCEECRWSEATHAQCDSCLNDKEQKAYEEGKLEGIEQGEKQGYDEGFKVGYTQGKEDGKTT